MGVSMQINPPTDVATGHRRFPLTATDVAVGDTVTGAVVVLDREDKQTRKGKAMAMLSLRNATGAASLPVWEEQLPAAVGLRAGLPVLLTATWAPGSAGNGQWRFDSAEALPADHPVLLEAQPVAPVTLAELGARTAALLSVLSPEARELFDLLMNTPVAWPDGPAEPMKARFIEAPAATVNHHPTIRGLFFHVVQTTELALAAAETLRRTGDAPGLDKDAVVLGGFWHDVGKLDELSWRGAFKYSARGAGASHMGWGMCRITEAVTRAETASGWRPTARQRELIDHLLHIVASHHGQKDWGALVEPASREAWCVSAADNLSSKVQPITDAAGAGTPLADGWTRVGTGRFGRTQFISPTASRTQAARTEDGVLRLVLPQAGSEVTDDA